MYPILLKTRDVPGAHEFFLSRKRVQPDYGEYCLTIRSPELLDERNIVWETIAEDRSSYDEAFSQGLVGMTNVFRTFVSEFDPMDETAMTRALSRLILEMDANFIVAERCPPRVS